MRHTVSIGEDTGKRSAPLGSGHSTDSTAVGLPPETTTLLFDLDGVITQTARIHAAAWKTMFDEFLARRSESSGDKQAPFDISGDYEHFVDGKPRYDGVRSFLASRSIVLNEGAPSDPAGAETVCGLGNRKNDLVLELIRRDGVLAYPGTVKYLDQAERAELRCAVVSSSANCRDVLRSCGLIDRFEVIVDGLVAAERGLAGKPAPDTFLAAAAALGAEPQRCAVFEDALAGVAAGRSGGFGFVIGVDRTGQRAKLLDQGADLVVDDLEELLP